MSGWYNIGYNTQKDSKMKYIGLRKIKNGRIKLLNNIYIPADYHKKYNGELDNTTWLFIKYDDCVAMWGDKQRYLASKNDESYVIDCQRKQANVDEHGYIYWTRWIKIK